MTPTEVRHPTLTPGEGDADSGLRRPTPNRLRGKRVWKAYHERQVLLAKDRQRSRALCRESGDGHRRLPDVGGRTAGVTAIAAARNQPSAVRFNREGVEFTADSLGANGCFIDIYNSGDDGESICSVLSFEDLYAETTQVTDALATVERARESEPVKPLPPRWPRAAANEGGRRRVDGDWREQQRRAHAASRSETASAATDPKDTTLLDRRRSSGGSVAPTVDGDSVDATVSNLDSVSHDLLEYITTSEFLSFSLDLDGLRTEGGISEEVDGGIFSPLNRLRRRGSRGRASSSWTSVARAKVETAAFAVAGAADNSADRYEKPYTLAAPSDGASLATVAGAPLSTPGVGSAGGLSETGGRGISASRWPVERKRPSVGVSGSAAEELEGSGNVAEDLSSISTTITDVAAASKGERSSQALESRVDSVVTTAAGNSSALDFTLGSVDSPSGIGSAVAGIGPATKWVSKWTGS